MHPNCKSGCESYPFELFRNIVVSIALMKNTLPMLFPKTKNENWLLAIIIINTLKDKYGDRELGLTVVEELECCPLETRFTPSQER